MSVLIGRVIDTPVLNQNTCVYHIQVDEKKYKVISKGYQAAKDHIFVEKEQQIRVEGRLLDDSIYVEKSRIDLRKL